MKNNLFFDIQLGASGDMLLAALFDFGFDYNELLKYLSLLELPNWEIKPQRIIKQNIAGTLANITCKNDAKNRNLRDIKKVIRNSKLMDSIKANIIKIFERLAYAEAKIHGKKLDEIHFHEIGAIDSIIDISSFCIAIHILRIEEIYFNEFCLGSGTIKSNHGEIPIPVPAVVELINGYKLKLTDKKGELITPTAAAILTTLGKQMNYLNFTIIKSGIGFGIREYDFPSYTRSFLIKSNSETKEVQQLECNIDDMNPQLYPNVIEKLLDAGALDAYTSCISMKKGRPGILLTVIAEIEKIPDLKKIIYSNTTTLGLRIFNINREKLNRRYEKVSIFNQEIRIKIGYLNNNKINIQPEFEDCRKAANKLNIPVKDIISEAISEYSIKIKNKME